MTMTKMATRRLGRKRMITGASPTAAGTSSAGRHRPPRQREREDGEQPGREHREAGRHFPERLDENVGPRILHALPPSGHEVLLLDLECPVDLVETLGNAREGRRSGLHDE